jgi:hypothetical protein
MSEICKIFQKYEKSIWVNKEDIVSDDAYDLFFRMVGAEMFKAEALVGKDKKGHKQVVGDKVTRVMCPSTNRYTVESPERWNTIFPGCGHTSHVIPP